MVEDFILHALTGKFVTGRVLPPSSLYYDMNTGDYFPEMLDYLALDRSRFPGLHDPVEMVVVCHGEFLPEFAGAVASVAPLDHVCDALGAVAAGQNQPQRPQRPRRFEYTAPCRP